MGGARVGVGGVFSERPADETFTTVTWLVCLKSLNNASAIRMPACRLLVSCLAVFVLLRREVAGPVWERTNRDEISHLGCVHCVSPAVFLVLCIVVVVALILSQSSRWVELCCPKRCLQVLAPVLVNDPSFGDGVFTNVIS